MMDILDSLNLCALSTLGITHNFLSSKISFMDLGFSYSYLLAGKLLSHVLQELLTTRLPSVSPCSSGTFKCMIYVSLC